MVIAKKAARRAAFSFGIFNLFARRILRKPCDDIIALIQGLPINEKTGNLSLPAFLDQSLFRRLTPHDIPVDDILSSDGSNVIHDLSAKRTCIKLK